MPDDTVVRMPRRKRKAPAEEEENTIEAEVVDETPAPTRRRRKSPVAEEEEPDEVDETPAPKRRKRRTKAEMEADKAAEEPEEEEPEEEEEDEEEEEPAPAPRKKRRAAPPVEEEEEEAPKPRAKKRAKKKVAADTSVARHTGGIKGMKVEADAEELETPTFKLLHQMSPDAEDMMDLVGHFVYNKELDLGTNLLILIVGYDRRYREICDWDPVAPPEEFVSRKEAAKAGVKVKPFAIVDILIPLDQEGLEDYEDEALMEIEGTGYLMAQWYITSGFKKFASPLRIHLNKGLDSTTYDRYYQINVLKGSTTGRKSAVLKPTTEMTTELVRSTLDGMVGD